MNENVSHSKNKSQFNGSKNWFSAAPACPER
jgi:hypothetical protein